MKTFMIIWVGQLISIMGSGLTGFALGVWIFERTGQATPFAITALCGVLPRVLLAPFGGSLADRWNRRWIMILADVGAALVTLSVVLLLFSGQLAVWHIYVIALLSSVFSAFQEPAYSASIAMLVPKKDLARANGLVQMGQAVENIVSPTLAGVLFGAVGIEGIILIDFCTFFFAIGALLFVHIPQPRVSPADETGRKGTVWRDVLFGWRYLYERPGLLGLLLYFAMVNFMLNFAMALTGPLVLSFGTASTMGVLQTAAGVGMLVGSIVMSTWGGPKRRIPAVIGFITLAAFGLALIGVYPSAVVVGAGAFLLLFCVPLASGPSQAVFQSKVAPDVQGRVFATRGMVSRSMMPLAFLTVGPLADYVFEPWMAEGGMLGSTFLGSLLGTGPGRGMGLMFVLSGLGLVLASIGAFANPRIRLVEEELPDAVPDEPEKEAPPAAEMDVSPAK
jgi:MFS family permease